MRFAQSSRYRSLRVGDTERNSAVESLNNAWVDGRLDADELEHRRDQAMRALTYGELNRLTVDIPGASVVPLGRAGSLVAKPSGRAVACVTLGFAGWLGPNFFAWIPAVVLGHRARRDLRQSGSAAGYELTTIGLAVAYAGLAFEAIAVIVVLAIVLAHV
jgi:hypothetical protein